MDVALGAGVVDRAGTRHRRARLGPVTGVDEDRAGDFGPVPDPDGLDDLLAGVLVRLGGYAPVATEVVAALTRSDRARLLLALRAALAGDEIRLIAPCPNPDCGEIAEVVLSVAALLGPGPGTADSVDVDTSDGRFRVRLPRGADDAAVAVLPDGERNVALWRRIVEPDPSGAGPASTAALAAALAELGESVCAPDLAVVARCPECAAWLELDPDPADLLGRAQLGNADRLLAEVHCLAYHYGWAQADILALSRNRRHRYLDLLRRQLDGRPLVDLGR
ncbi:hypothetical protein [Micromonospora sp. CB01531]|uniref:hypothetical protein n=1 Tax=Micromonospora sp. CB01531 TaxID=1718947 RepID=UPI00093CB69F|nr:hypothetical protein [Micromonospora sp. CB01531]OKI51391.1 hypothetical protein A6A27_33495 [Micromonospora sp. CB01531]